VAVNLIIDPSWDHERFETIRKWCNETPELVNYAVLTPYPGTETWYTEARQLISRDYRLFDLQHCVLPTKLPLADFYQELIDTYANMYNKIDDWRGVLPVAPTVIRNLLRGQTNFMRIFWDYKTTYNTERLLSDHARPVEYEISLPPEHVESVDPKMLYVHNAHGRQSRALDEASEQFVDATRMSVST
jgi:hopanoid C-3 methylase